MPRSREPPVQIVGGPDQRQEREGLREIAEELCPRAQLLTLQSHVIRIANHLVEEEPRLVEIAHARETLDVQKEHMENVPSRGRRRRDNLQREIAWTVATTDRGTVSC